MVVFSRDRIRSASMMTRRSSPGRRRLRFSFPINDVKDQNRETRPAVQSPAAAESGVFKRREIRSQPDFSEII
jgi:hypothetical protein